MFVGKERDGAVMAQNLERNHIRKFKSKQDYILKNQSVPTTPSQKQKKEKVENINMDDLKK